MARWLWLVAPCVALPWVLSQLPTGNYLLHIFVVIAITSITVQSTNVILGYCGQLSMAQAALMGVGAYTSALWVMKLPGLGWLGLPLGGIVASVAAMIIGIPALRLKGIYFAMATFAFGALFTLFLHLTEALTGGTQGLGGVPTLPAVQLGGLVLDPGNNLVFAYLTEAILVGVCVIVALLNRTTLGAGWLAIREDDLLAATFGVSVYRHKVAAFAFAAFLAGISGGLYAHFIRYLEPQVFALDIGISFLAMGAVGGLGALEGPIYGTAFMTIVPEAMRGLVDYSYVLLGLMLVFTIIAAPQGIAGFVRRLKNTFTRARGPERVELQAVRGEGK